MLVDVYVSSVSAYLALRQAALTLRHPDDLGKEKVACIEYVNQAQSHLITVQEELDAIKGKHNSTTEKIVQLEEAFRIAYEEEQKLQSDVEAKFSLVATVEEQVIEKKQALTNLEIVPTSSQEEAEKLKEHECNVLEL